MKQKTDLEEEEMNTQHGYEGMLQKLNDEIENADSEIKRRSKVSAERQQDQAAAEQSLAQTSADRQEDQTYLDDLTNLCMAKARDYEKRQALRGEEIKTLTE